MNNLIKLVATDLDGTLLRDDKSVSLADIHSLKLLGQKGIVRVAATGRSMHKVNEVLSIDDPFDYIVFSSGSGVYDWNRQELCIHVEFSPIAAIEICAHLLRKDLNFFVYQPIPRNNHFWYHQGSVACNEFEAYVKRHQGDCVPLNQASLPESTGQIMCILPHNEVLFEEVKADLESTCDKIKIIRTTSPVNGQFIWLEIFPETVSKGNGIGWICNKHLVQQAETAALGNDYNDIDMLEFVGKPFVVQNSTITLRSKFPTIGASNNESPFTRMLIELHE